MDSNNDCFQDEQIALLAILAMGTEEIAQGKIRDVEDVFAELDEVESPSQPQ